MSLYGGGALCSLFRGLAVLYFTTGRCRRAALTREGRAGAARGPFPARRRRRRSRSRIRHWIRRHRGRAGVAQVRKALRSLQSRSPATPAPPARTETPPGPAPPLPPVPVGLRPRPSPAHAAPTGILPSPRPGWRRRFPFRAACAEARASGLGATPCGSSGFEGFFVIFSPLEN